MLISVLRARVRREVVVVTRAATIIVAQGSDLEAAHPPPLVARGD